MKFKDYYGILGVKSDASAEEIRKAYKRLACTMHPDGNLNSGLSIDEIKKLEEQIKDVNVAYEVLKNPETRSDYYCQLLAYHIGKAQEKHKKAIAKDLKKKNRIVRRKSPRKKTIMEEYKELRKEERKSFAKRHRKVSKIYNKAYSSNVDSIPKKFVFNIGKGTVHVMHEAFYQFSKLKKSSEDTVTRYVLKNRNLFAVAGIAAVVFMKGFSGGQATPTEELLHTTDNIHYTSETANPVEFDAEKTEEDNIITLNKNHKIKSGDTLYQMSVDSATDEYTLRVLNDISSSLIYIGDSMTVPYRINKEDLEHYTMKIDTDNHSIYELAHMYNTDAESIYKLNKESIRKYLDNYIILSDELVVPKFISRDDLQEIKNNASEKVQLVK